MPKPPEVNFETSSKLVPKALAKLNFALPLLNIKILLASKYQMFCLDESQIYLIY